MVQDSFIDTLLLLALPASGKSEVRRFMLHAPRQQRIEQYHIADTPQLDDFPYVHFVRRVDAELVARGQERRFFGGENAGFLEGRDWGTLLQLVNDDYAVMKDPSAPTPTASAATLFERIDAARGRVGAPAVFGPMDAGLRAELVEAMQPEADTLVGELFGARPETIDDKTLVIEFARGGPEGASMPLSAPHGYAWNLSQLSPELLRRAGILYIWVTPEESRRKNIARARPGEDGSILHHSAPESVMRGDYGCDDMEYLIEASDRPDTIRIESAEGPIHVPIARFDNRVDKTTFVHGEPESWAEADVKALDDGLTGPMQKLWKAYVDLRS